MGKYERAEIEAAFEEYRRRAEPAGQTDLMWETRPAQWAIEYRPHSSGGSYEYVIGGVT